MNLIKKIFSTKQFIINTSININIYTTLTLTIGLALSTNCFSMQNQQNFAANTQNNSNNSQQNNTHNQNNQDHANDPSYSPNLYNAIENNNIDLAMKLIVNNIGTKYRNNDNITPLHIACKNGHFEVTELLIAHGADVNAKNTDNSHEFCIDPEFEDITPLHLACQNGHLEIAKLLIDNKADINAENGWNHTPLHFACENNHLEIAKLLIDNKAEINIIGKLPFGTPLHLACQNGDFEITQLLIDNKANINACTESSNTEENNNTPLHVACDNNHFEIAKLLIANGANINEENDLDLTPLDFAFKENNLGIVNLLLKNGAEHKNIDLEDLGARSIDAIKKIVYMGFDLNKQPLVTETLISGLLANFEQINDFEIITNGTNGTNLNNIDLDELDESIENHEKKVFSLYDGVSHFMCKTNTIIPINKINNLIIKVNDLKNYINSANNMLKTCCDQKNNIEENIKSNQEADQNTLEKNLKYFNNLEMSIKNIIDLYKREKQLTLNIIHIYFYGNPNYENLIYTKISELSQELKTLIPQTDFTENNKSLKEINNIVLYCQTILNENEQNPDYKNNFTKLLDMVKSTLKELSGVNINLTLNLLLDGVGLFYNKTYEENVKILSKLINDIHYLKNLSEDNFYKIRWLTTNDFDTVLKNKILYKKCEIKSNIWNLKFEIIELITENDQISYYTKLLALSYLASIRFQDKKTGEFTNLISNREIIDCMKKTFFCYDFFHNPLCKRLRARCFEIEESNDENTPHVKDIFGIGLVNALSEYPKFIPAFFNLAKGSLLKQYKEVNNETTNKEKAPKAQEELKKAEKNTESKEESTIETTFVDHILLNNEELVRKLTNQSNSANIISKKIDLTNTDENSIMRAAKMVSPITLDNITVDLDKSYSVNEFHKRFVNTFSLYHLLQGIGVKDHKINFSDAGEPVSEEESLTSLPTELITKILSFTDGTLAKTEKHPFTGNYETLSDDASYLPSEKYWQPLSNVKEKKKKWRKNTILSVDELLNND